MKLKCSKCDCKQLNLNELWKNHCADYFYDNGAISSKGNLSEGDPYMVEAQCTNCGHTWKVKGARQISDVGDID